LTVSLRPVVPEDAPLVRAVSAAARNEVEGLPEALLGMQQEAQRSDYAARFPDADEEIVLHDGVAVGRLWVERHGDPWRVLDIALVGEARGRGIGTAVLSGVIDEADRAKVAVALTVACSNRDARRLYARLGFAAVADDGLWIVMERSSRPAASLPATH
jgi:ribosomal protein S18 acetylase RimI-like enzyme